MTRVLDFTEVLDCLTLGDLEDLREGVSLLNRHFRYRKALSAYMIDDILSSSWSTALVATVPGLIFAFEMFAFFLSTLDSTFV